MNVNVVSAFERFTSFTIESDFQEVDFDNMKIWHFHLGHVTLILYVYHLYVSYVYIFVLLSFNYMYLEM